MSEQTTFHRKRVVSAIGKRLQQDAWFYYAAIAYTIVALVYLALVGTPGATSHALYIWPAIKGFAVLMPLVALGFDAVLVIARFDSKRMLAFRRTFSSERLAALAAGILLMAGVTLVQGSFTSIKNALPLIYGGFPHDRLQADIDAMLHFGVDPWRLYYAVAGSPLVRSVIEFNYNVVWFILNFGALFYVATSPRADGVRTRYLAMFLFVWIVCGNLLAGLFLSAGPAYYGDVTGDYTRFGAQLAFLAESHWQHSAAAYQEYLWSLYASNGAGFGGGISAFPSVHVGLVAMNAFFLAERSRIWGSIGFAYVVLVAISSVYLAWHYAIDGYVSLLVVALGHVMMRRFLGSANRHPVGDFATKPSVSALH